MSEFVQDVAKAAKALRSLFDETPLQRNEYLSQKYDAEIYLKREDLTPVRSYKIRGAFNFISQMLDKVSPEAAFVCASAGNHAQGLAFACHHFKRKGVIFMPVTTPQQKIDKTRTFGGKYIEIRMIGDTFDECYAAAKAFVADGGGVMAPPFDDMRIVTGQATVMYEAAEQWKELVGDEKPDLVIIPVGGGGLAAGISHFIRESGWTKTHIHFAEPEGAASLYTSLKEGKRVKLEDVDTFVDGAAVAQIGELNFKMLKGFSPFDVSIVPENRLSATMVEMLNVEGIVLEPAGGYQGLKKYFIFRFPQRPGALRGFLDQLGPDDDVARFEYLKKSARNFGSVLIAIETKRFENFAVLESKFKELGWAYRDITNDRVLFDYII